MPFSSLTGLFFFFVSLALHTSEKDRHALRVPILVLRA
jgi:hypothetical protein